MKNITVVGASRGIGAAVADAMQTRASRVMSVSRSPAPAGQWVQADVTTAHGVAAVVDAVKQEPLDALLYMGGTWETDAFTPAYRFETSPEEEIDRVIAVNLIAPIKLVRALLPALRRADNPKVVFMGALSGLDNFPSREVANSASKFGLRGAVHALREELRKDRIAVTVINPGNIGTPEVLQDLKEAGEPEESAIPLRDLLSVLTCVLSLSRSTSIKEIQLPAMSTKGA